METIFFVFADCQLRKIIEVRCASLLAEWAKLAWRPEVWIKLRQTVAPILFDADGIQNEPISCCEIERASAALLSTSRDCGSEIVGPAFVQCEGDTAICTGCSSGKFPRPLIINVVSIGCSTDRRRAVGSQHACVHKHLLPCIRQGYVYVLNDGRSTQMDTNGTRVRSVVGIINARIRPGGRRT